VDLEGGEVFPIQKIADFPLETMGCSASKPAQPSPPAPRPGGPIGTGPTDPISVEEFHSHRTYDNLSSEDQGDEGEPSASDLWSISSPKPPPHPVHLPPEPPHSPTNGMNRPPVVLPDDYNFHPSINGRNQWKLENIYSAGVSLGEGAFGTVFKSNHKLAVRDEEWAVLAVKRTKPTLLDYRDYHDIQTYDDVEKGCQEIKTLCLLREGSPSMSPVLYLYEYFWTGQNLYMVTELLGQELDEWRTAQDVFTERMAIDICRTVLNAIDFMHKRGVVHRDIKLQNILFRTPGNFKSLKVVDFGLARCLDDTETTRDFCGSLGYIAPEIYEGRRYRYEVDMFAFGVLLFRLLSGERPFPSNNQEVLKRNTIELRYNVQGQDWLTVSAAAKDLVRKLLINRQERLTAERALGHPWFLERGQSVLRVDFSQTMSNEEAKKGSRSRAFLLVRNRKSGVYCDYASVSQLVFVVFFVFQTQAPTQSVSQRGDGSRFWLDSSVQLALGILMSTDIYSGRVVDQTRAQEESGEADLICVEEIVPPDTETLPLFVGKMQRYTERECRGICKQIALGIQTLHRAGIAHRNLHMENVIVDRRVRV
jgi:serine/threonine protein kinase